MSRNEKNSEDYDMLHAFCHRKSGLYKRYLGHREPSEKRVCEEDEITALIMGPLDYLPAEATGMFWRALVENGGLDMPAPFPTGPVNRAQMHFWPRRGIEPDLYVELYWPTGERRLLLVEFKWNAPLSGDDQLHRQWREFLISSELKDAYHIFIAPEISAGLSALGEQDIWHGRLILRSWITILDVLRHLDGSRIAGLEKWKSQVITFLEQLGINRFQGFRDLLPPLTLPKSPAFWSPLNGFSGLVAPTSLPRDTQSPFFIWSSAQ
ncbi:hypothetical protein [Pseudomonas graminis]|uniref:hypothetical protein n=1 Tax=Pseudomonas graminis TaxID=158627 RepID=UPI003C255A2E